MDQKRFEEAKRKIIGVDSSETGNRNSLREDGSCYF